jgi:hypothetical protein
MIHEDKNYGPTVYGIGMIPFGAGFVEIDELITGIVPLKLIFVLFQIVRRDLNRSRECLPVLPSANCCPPNVPKGKQLGSGTV